MCIYFFKKSLHKPGRQKNHKSTLKYIKQKCCKDIVKTTHALSHALSCSKGLNRIESKKSKTKMNPEKCKSEEKILRKGQQKRE